MDKRNKVVIKSIAGKDEKFRALSIYKDTNKTIREIVIFKAIQTSSSPVGSGNSMMHKINMRAHGIAMCT